MKPNTIAVIKFLQTNPGVDFTAAEVAEALGLTAKSVNAIFSFSIQAKGFGSRVVSEVIAEDGEPKEVKYLKLNPAGLTLEV